jgi:aspartyl/asparaginyl beta-hydroxylase (cupin superfamily)
LADETQALEEAADRAAASGEFGAALALLERAVDSRSDSTGLWMKLSAMRKAMGDQKGALEALDRLLAVAPGDVPALLSRAVILDNLADPDAGEAYEQALAHVPDDADIPAEFRAITAHARKRRDEYRITLERYLGKDLPSDLTPAERSRAERLITNRSRNTLPYQQHPCDFFYPGMPAIEFHDRELFPGLAALEQATDAIRTEFSALLSAEVAEMVPYVQFPDRVPLRQWKELNNNPQWTAIHLLQNGLRVEANARHCPQTLEAVSKMDQPRVPGASPVAMFSLLAPRTRIPPHRGVVNTRLVCHLPLIVPEQCGFRCGATTREWRVGEAFVFDDTIEHEAWNDSDELRVVLILDLWAPALGPGDRRAVAAVIGASNRNFVQARGEG